MRHASAAALLLFLAFGSTATSSDITTVNGTLYHDAHVTAVDPDGLHVAHKFGVAKIPFEELPQDLRTKYHYDKRNYRVVGRVFRNSWARDRRVLSSDSGGAPEAECRRNLSAKPFAWLDSRRLDRCFNLGVQVGAPACPIERGISLRHRVKACAVILSRTSRWVCLRFVLRDNSIRHGLGAE